MGRLARRTFLFGSLAIAGGVVFGLRALRSDPGNPLAGEPGALSAFLRIDADAITVITPRAEMGQGIHTTLAALVAEELDVDWADIRTDHGPPARAYYNSALLRGDWRFHPEGLSAPGMPGEGLQGARLSGWQQALADSLGSVGKVLDLQLTGGSTSILDGFDRLRRTGASARETLKAAAADRHGIAADRLGTEAGHVVLPDGIRIPYADLAEAAAARDPVPAEPRPAGAWRLLGRPLPRVDMVAKATGTATFSGDIRLPGMRFATVRMTPHPGGGMDRFDPAEALEMPGVDTVIDLDTGFAVVARSTWEAMQAADAVDVSWTEGPGPQDTAAIFERIRQAFGTRRNSRPRNDGDVERAFQLAGTVISAEYRVPFLHHATMEPMGAAALYETGETDRLTLWTGNQAPILHRDKAAEAVGLDADAVTVITPMMGGGFGRRTETDFSVLAARVARAVPDVPVQVTWSREEDFTHGFYRPGAIARMRGALAGGGIDAFEARVAAPSVTRQAARRMAGFAPPGPDRGHLEGMADQPYEFPHARVEGYLAEMPVPVGFWRAVGTSFNGFFHESFIDELAHTAGRDPLEFRLAHLGDGISRGVVEAVGEMSGWGAEKPQGLGRGVAFTRSFGTPVAQVVEVRDEGGAIRISRAWVACDIGLALDPGIIRQQMEGGLIFGLSAAALQAITFRDGMVEQQNFPDHDALRITNAPEVAVRILQSHRHIGGAGEPATPPAMAALANAVFDLTGERIRELPLSRQVDFVM